jgi:hypothetical protein
MRPGNYKVFAIGSSNVTATGITAIAECARGNE